MKKLTSVSYSDWAFNLAMLLIRAGAGVMIASHGYDKLVHFAAKKEKFMNFMGLGSGTSLCLVIFAEFFCAIFLIIGLFSRMVSIPLIIAMCVALFKAHNGEIFGQGQAAALFLLSFLTILLCGPGRASIDGMIK